MGSDVQYALDRAGVNPQVISIILQYLFKENSMYSKSLSLALVAAVLFLASGMHSQLDAALNTFSFKNNAPCAATVTVFFSDGSVKGPGVIPSGSGGTTCLPAGVVVIGFVINGVPLLPPAPGFCVLTGLLCPSQLCNIGGVGQNYQLF